jgi:hypothetical protein
MMTFIKNNLIKLVLTVLLIIWMSLNCSGFCFDKTRILSDDEKIRIVVEEILRSYGAKIDSEWIAGPKLGEGHSIKSNKWVFGPGKRLKWEAPDSDVKELPAYPIPYRDIDEFFSLNPDCCYVTQRYKSTYDAEDGAVAGCGWFGGSSAIVVVTYVFKYKDETGMIQNEQLVVYRAMNNCGKFINDYQ